MQTAKASRKQSYAMQDMWVESLGREDPLEEERVGHDLARRQSCEASQLRALSCPKAMEAIL